MHFNSGLAPVGRQVPDIAWGMVAIPPITSIRHWMCNSVCMKNLTIGAQNVQQLFHILQLFIMLKWSVCRIFVAINTEWLCKWVSTTLAGKNCDIVSLLLQVITCNSFGLAPAGTDFFQNEPYFGPILSSTFLARDVIIYISRLCHDASPSVCRLSVTLMHCGHRVRWIPDIFTCLDRLMSLLLNDNAWPGSSDGMIPGFLVEEGGMEKVVIVAISLILLTFLSMDCNHVTYLFIYERYWNYFR